MYLESLKVGVESQELRESYSETHGNSLLNQLAYWKQKYQEMKLHRDEIKEELVHQIELLRRREEEWSSQQRSTKVEWSAANVESMMAEQQRVIQALRERIQVQEELELRCSRLEQNETRVKEQEEVLNRLMYRIQERDEKIRYLEEQSRKTQLRQVEYYEEQLSQLKRQVAGVRGQDLRVELEREKAIRAELEERHQRLIRYVTDLESELSMAKSTPRGVIQYRVVCDGQNEDKIAEVFRQMHPSEGEVRVQRL